MSLFYITQSEASNAVLGHPRNVFKTRDNTMTLYGHLWTISIFARMSYLF